MKLRPFGNTGMNVSEIGLGAWQLANPEWGINDRQEALRIIQKSLEVGCNFFDTAPGYGGGRSEELLGDGLKSVRKDVILCTKFSHYAKDGTRDFEARLLRERAVVRLSPAGLRLLRDVSEAAAEAAESSKRPCRPSGWIRAEIPIEGVEHAARQLLRLGADVQVLEPEALRERVAAHVRALADLYIGGRPIRALSGRVETGRPPGKRPDSKI